MIKPDKIIRSQRKTVSITVDNSGRLIVRAPLRCSEARILAFIEKKSDWILKHKARRSLTQNLFPGENLDGFQFALYGTVCTIRYSEGRKTVYSLEDGTLFLPKEKGEEGVRRWLKTQAKTVFSEIVQTRAKEMYVTYKAVSVSSAKGRWGSCSADNTLRFSFRLLYAPKAIVDYVVVHELAHTLHKNHGKAFWAKVEKHCPDWKVKRKWLKEHGYFMQIF